MNFIFTFLSFFFFLQFCPWDEKKSRFFTFRCERNISLLYIFSFYPLRTWKKKSFPTRKNKSPDSSFHSVSHKNIFFHKNVFSILLFIYFTFLFLQFCAWNEEENHIVSEMTTKKCLSKCKTFCFTQNFETKEKFFLKKKKNLKIICPLKCFLKLFSRSVIKLHAQRWY